MQFGILFAILILLALVGFTELLGLLAQTLLSPRRRPSCYSLLPILPGDSQVEEKLRWAAVSLQWDRWVRGGSLVLLNLGAVGETLSVCQAFAQNRDWVILCTPEELPQAVGDPGVYKTFKGVLY